MVCWGHIRCLGDGCFGFRPYGGSLWKSPKVTKGLLPHHSAPRLGSVCPNEGLNPWAAVTGHPWPNTANPASCRVTHGFKPAFGQRGLTGRLRSRSKSTARRPSSRPEWLDQKRRRGGLTAGLILKAQLNQRWELACLRWHRLGVTDRPRCLHRRQASSHRKAKQCGAGSCTRSTCGSGLAREGGVSATHELTDPPPSRASPLPHLDLSASDRDVLLCCCPASASTTQVGFQAAVLCF